MLIFCLNTLYFSVATVVIIVGAIIGIMAFSVYRLRK